MTSNSTLKVPTTAFMPHNAFTKTTSFFWGFILLIALLFSGVSFGQGATCATATPLTIDGACDAGLINDTTQSLPNISNVGCPTGTFRREGWYTFTVSGGPTDISIVADAGNRNLFLQLISSTSACSGLTQIACSNNNNGNYAQNETINTTLNNGIYYIKVVNVGSNGTMTLNSICLFSPPSNDDCAGAIELFSDYTCNTVTGSTAGATESLAGCLGEALHR
jgi:hypothetical protein